MKNIFLLLALVFGFYSITNAQSDPKSKKILSTSKKKFSSLKDYKAGFNYKMENLASKDKPLVKKGTVFVKKNMYKIELPDQVVYCNGEKVWVHLIKEKEVTVSDFDPDESMSISKVYTVYEDDMKSRYDGAKTINGVACHKITLFSKDQDSEYWKVEVLVNQKTNLVEQSKLFGRNGTNHTYTLTSAKSNSGLSSSMFTFDKSKHPGVEVIDF